MHIGLYKSIAELMFPRGFKCLISLFANPVSILSDPVQTVRPLKPLTPLIGLTQALFSGTKDRKIPFTGI
jgi:hypothetical protein